MSSNNKKRKYEDEKRRFKSEWEEAYAFTSKDGKPVCLICHASLATFKVFNLKRHYETNHVDFASEYPSDSELRKNVLTELKANLLIQQTLHVLSSFSNEADTATEAGFVISWNMARAKRPCYDGEFLKKNIAEVVSVLNPSNSKLQRLISQIPVSHANDEGRVSQISADIEEKLHNDLESCVAFSLALDDSIGVQDNPKLAIFVRYVAGDLAVSEELLDVVALQGSPHGADIKKALDAVLENSGVNVRKLVSVATDGTSTMLCKNLGLVGLLATDPKYPEFIPVHCIVRIEQLVAQYFNYECVMKTSLNIINFIRSNVEAHRHFKNFLEELELEDVPEDVVTWFSNSSVLSRFVELLEPIVAFLALLNVKEKGYLQLGGDEWLQDLMFLTDVIQHLHTLNVALQGKDKLISDLAQTVFSFQKKIQLLQRDVISGDLNHFPHLKSRVSTFPTTKLQDRKVVEYRDKLQDLLDDFRTRYDGLQKLKSAFAFLVNPFMVDVIGFGFPALKPLLEEVSIAEMELVELQEDQVLQMMHKAHSTIDFWKLVPENKYPQLKKASSQLISMFGTTRCLKTLSSKMSFMKSKHSAFIGNQCLTEHLRIACTNYQPDFKYLAAMTEIQTVPGSSNH